MSGRTIRLEGIDPDLVRGVQVVPRFRIQRGDVAGRALALVIEDLLASCRSGHVETPGGRSRRLERELIGVKRGEFRRDEVRSSARVPRAAPCGYRILHGI